MARMLNRFDFPRRQLTPSDRIPILSDRIGILSPRHPAHSEENPMAKKYGSKAKSEVKKAMHEKKRGQLKSGRSGKTVKSRKQAIAIGLSKARKKGAKVPAKSKS